MDTATPNARSAGVRGGVSPPPRSQPGFNLDQIELPEIAPAPNVGAGVPARAAAREQSAPPEHCHSDRREESASPHASYFAAVKSTTNPFGPTAIAFPPRQIPTAFKFCSDNFTAFLSLISIVSAVPVASIRCDFLSYPTAE